MWTRLNSVPHYFWKYEFMSADFPCFAFCNYFYDVQQVLEVTNHTTNKVRFQLTQELPSWLSISPAEGVLQPGQQIVLQVCCDKEVAESR